MKAAVAVAVALMGLVVVAVAEGRSHASAPAPALGGGGDKCMSAVMNNMITCMDYVVEGATEKKPDKACCNGTRVVMKEAGAECLCLAFSAAPAYGIHVDVSKAAALPSLCHIPHAPSLSNCLAAAEVPAAAPKPASHHNHHESAPAPAPAEGSSAVASVSYGLMAVVALLSLAFSA